MLPSRILTKLPWPLGSAGLSLKSFVALHDQVAQGKNPILRRRVFDVIPNVKVGLDPRALEGSDEVFEKGRLHPQIVPDILEGDDDAGFLRQWNQTFDPFPEVSVAWLWALMYSA